MIEILAASADRRPFRVSETAPTSILGAQHQGVSDRILSIPGNPGKPVCRAIEGLFEAIAAAASNGCPPERRYARREQYCATVFRE